MAIKLSILVFVASPLDYARYRHTALYIEYDDPENAQTQSTDQSAASIKSSLSEVVGSTGFYSYSERLNWAIPVSSANVARIVPVSTFDAAPATVRETIASIPIPEDGSWGDDWNSQDWVADVLGKFVKMGVLDGGVRERAVDGMVSAVCEAGDEEVLA